MKSKKQGVGRPKGKTTGYTEPGRTMPENLHRAIWGAHHKPKEGAGWMHELWTRRKNDREELAFFISWMFKAIEQRDGDFFIDAGNVLKRIANDEGILDPDQPDDARLLAYVGKQLEANPSKKFSIIELIDSVRWVGSCPSERNLGRRCRKFGVPMLRGAPKKTK